MIIFCKNCQYTGLPKQLPGEELIDGNAEVCPKCNTSSQIDYHLDAAAAEHAKAHFNENAEEVKP